MNDDELDLSRDTIVGVLASNFELEVRDAVLALREIFDRVDAGEISDFEGLELARAVDIDEGTFEEVRNKAMEGRDPDEAKAYLEVQQAEVFERVLANLRRQRGGRMIPPESMPPSAGG